MEKTLIEQFDVLCGNNESHINDGMNDEAKIVSIYSFYHYLNGDVSQLDDLQLNIITAASDFPSISGMFKSEIIDGDAVDFLCGISDKSKLEFSEQGMRSLASSLLDKVGKIVTKQKDVNFVASRIINEIAPGIFTSSTAFYSIRVLCNFELPVDQKVLMQDLFSNQQAKEKNVSFEILFADDIQQEIDDFEAPKNSVPQGSLNFYGSNDVCKIGDNGSFVCVVSAFSIKKLFQFYSTRGLFASNLRFFISSKKIDPKIINTIQTEPENFVYYNNGIIITCDDWKISESKIALSNFSIVNGGQTTNLIGRTSFNVDFGVVCKIIKSKPGSEIEKAQFLSKVAEASNTQKPINARDLIANRTEQRLLKNQFASFDVFLKVKRGEKINKTQYPEAWQNSSNDEVAQMLYSCVYQKPGDAKNSKSKLLSNDDIYNVIFGNSYSNNFLLSLQYLKASYAKCKSKIAKYSARGDIKSGLSRVGDLLALGVLGFVFKFLTNKSFAQGIEKFSGTTFFSDNQDLKFLLSQNDIGRGNLIKEEILGKQPLQFYFPIFDYLFDNVLEKAYTNFKRNYPLYSFSHFSKLQRYYFNYVIPAGLRFVTNSPSEKHTSIFDILDVNQDSSINFSSSQSFNDYKPGLFDELNEFRSKVIKERKEQGERITNKDVLTDLQIEKIMNNLPKNDCDLLTKCKLNSIQQSRYGYKILQIVSKYCTLDGFKLND